MASTLNDALEIVARTDPGMVRTHNEDAVFANPTQGFVILADGMGGYNAGEVASGMATMLLSSEFEAAFSATSPSETDRASGESFARKCIREKVAAANSAIYNAAASQPQYVGMGTTLVTAVFHDNQITVAHIGDSRLYRLRGEIIEEVTNPADMAEAFKLENRRVALDEFGEGTKVSAVFLGIDHNFGCSETPILFLTMSWYNGEEYECKR